MGIPQILIIVWYALGLGVMLALHGKPQTESYSFWKSLFITVVMFALLYWGGFWN